MISWKMYLDIPSLKSHWKGITVRFWLNVLKNYNMLESHFFGSMHVTLFSLMVDLSI